MCSVWIEFWIEYCYVDSPDAGRCKQDAQQSGQLSESDSTWIRGIHCRHDRLMKHIGIEMDPEPGEIIPRHDFERFFCCGFRAFITDLFSVEGGDAGSIESIDIVRIFIGRITISSQRGHVFVTKIWFHAIDVRQCVRSVTGGKRKIKASCCVTAAPLRIARVRKIVVAIDKAEPVSVATPQGERDSQQDTAVATDNEREKIVPEKSVDLGC